MFRASASREKRSRLKNDRPGGDDALSLLHRDELVGFDFGNEVLLAAGPHDGQADRLALLRLAQTERERQLALGQVARPSLYHGGEPRAFAGLYRYLGPDAVTIGPRAHGFHPQHVVLVAIVVAQQSGRTTIGGNQKVEVAVIVEIAIGRSPSDDRPGQCLSYPGRHFIEFALAQVAEQK